MSIISTSVHYSFFRIVNPRVKKKVFKPWCTKGNTSNLSSTGCNLQNGALGLGVDGGELLELHGGGSGQGQQGKQQDDGQLLHLDPAAWT